jgi:hypothetical protein
MTSVVIDFAVASEFFQRAADSNNHKSANNWTGCLELGEGIEAIRCDRAELPLNYREFSAKT